MIHGLCHCSTLLQKQIKSATRLLSATKEMGKESMSRSLSVGRRCNAANAKLCGSLEDPPPPLQRRRFSKQSPERVMAGTRAGRRPGRRPGSGIKEPPVPQTYPL
jgi:hypothetical protein